MPKQQFVKEGSIKTKEVTISITNNLMQFTQSDEAKSQTAEFAPDLNSGQNGRNAPGAFGQTLNISTGSNFFSNGAYFQSRVQTMKNNVTDNLSNDYAERQPSALSQHRLSQQQCRYIKAGTPDQGTLKDSYYQSVID